jgi:hypothetical protein
VAAQSGAAADIHVALTLAATIAAESDMDASASLTLGLAAVVAAESSMAANLLFQIPNVRGFVDGSVRMLRGSSGGVRILAGVGGAVGGGDVSGAVEIEE